MLRVPMQTLLISAAQAPVPPTAAHTHQLLLFGPPSTQLHALLDHHCVKSLKSLQKPLAYTVLIIARCSAPFYRLPHPLELLKINLISSEADATAVVLLVISTGDTCS